MFDSGFNVSVIGFDYRYKDKPSSTSEPSDTYMERSPRSRNIFYKTSPVENYDTGIAQSMEGKRMWFDKESGIISLIDSSLKSRMPTQTEIREFINNIFDANIPLTGNEKEMLNKYLSE